MLDAIAIEEAERDLPPGIYIASSGSQAFGVLRAMATVGYARQLGERYLENGEKEIVVEVFDGERYAPNQSGDEGEAGALQMGPEFFASALDDYSHWKEAWWREAIQNGVDAEATEIKCSVAQQPDGTYVVSCEDNGMGMTKDVMRDVFMRLKGTAKAGGTGGFGEAKRLLVLPWIAYEMHSRDTLMQGSGAGYKTFPADPRRGTRLSVVMPADNATSAELAAAYISQCYVPHVRFTVEGLADDPAPRTVKANLKTGELIRKLEEVAELYYDKRKSAKKYTGIVVRMRNTSRNYALAMFQRYADVPGQLVLEITARSTEVLTSNRDGFRGWGTVGGKLREALDAYVSELSADVRSALRKKTGLIEEKFLTGEKFRAEVPEVKAVMLDKLGALEPAGRALGKGAHEMSADQIGGMLEVLTQLTVERSAERRTHMTPGVIEGEGRVQLAAAMLGGFAVAGAQQIETIVAQLAWEPDYFLANSIEGYKVPKRFRPESMTGPVRKLVRCWAELCRFVMMQLNSEEPFGVGVVIDESTGAEYRSDGGHWLMVNPFVHTDPRVDDTMWSMSDWESFMWLYAAAIHECTHLVDRITAHNEHFAAALTRNFAKCSGKEKQLKKIKSIVLAAEKETAAKLKAARQDTPPRAKAPRASKKQVEALVQLPPGGRYEREYRGTMAYPGNWTVISVEDPVDRGDLYELGIPAADSPGDVYVIRLPFTEAGLVDQLGLSNDDLQWIAESAGTTVDNLEIEAARDSKRSRLDALNWTLSAMDFDAFAVARRSGEPVYRIPRDEWDARWWV